jgi:hypothetical protein
MTPGTCRAVAVVLGVCLLTGTRPSALAPRQGQPAGPAQSSAAPAQAPAAYGSSCSALTGVGVSRATVTFTMRFPTGTFDPRVPAQQSVGVPAPFRDLPEFCRATLAAVSASTTFRGIEVWLPTHSWNGKLIVVGRNRDGASFDLGRMAAALAGNFVAAALDDRHAPAATRQSAAEDAAIAAAIQEATLTLQLLLEAYFGPGPTVAYWSGCGAGARDGLLTAERYPDAFDGILAGALSEASPASAGGARSATALGLAAYRARGGKVLLYDRAADAAAAMLPLRENRDVRLFLVPGEPSCPDVDDGRAAAMTRALDGWVGRASPPDRVVVPVPGAGPVAGTRLLCPFPLTPVYSGSGSRADAARFGCRGSDRP